MKKVDFFIVGSMKSGTTSLRSALRPHPGVGMPGREPQFFTVRYANGLDWYHSLFRRFSKDVLWGEKSPSYGQSDVAARRIHAYNPNARIIFTLRNPVRRAISHYYHSRGKLQDAARTLEEDLALKEYERNVNNPAGYIYRSQYEKHLALYERLFGRDRMLVLVLEEVIQHPEHWLNITQDFLGIERMSIVQWPHSNATSSGLMTTTPIAPETVERLRDVLAPTISFVEDYLGRPLPAWHH